MSPSAECVATALERARQHVKDLEQAKDHADDMETWSSIILKSLAFHREQRAYWRSSVHDLPAHLKEQVLVEDLGGQFEVSAEIDKRKPVTPTQAVRLPPPNAAALAALKPTGTAAAAELRKIRAAAGFSETPDGTPDGAESPSSTGLHDGAVTPQPSTSMRAGLGLHTPCLVTASKDPLRSARASPAQLPAGGLHELQAALARRRGGDA